MKLSIFTTTKGVPVRQMIWNQKLKTKTMLRRLTTRLGLEISHKPNSEFDY